LSEPDAALLLLLLLLLLLQGGWLGSNRMLLCLCRPMDGLHTPSLEQ
jgi:hypothetical protein